MMSQETIGWLITGAGVAYLCMNIFGTSADETEENEIMDVLTECDTDELLRNKLSCLQLAAGLKINEGAGAATIVGSADIFWQFLIKNDSADDE